PVMKSSSTVHYYKGVAGYTRYIPIGPVVWATEGRAGYLKNLSQEPDGAVPKIKAFILGGRSTIRGFDPAGEAFPNDDDQDFKNGILVESHFYLAKTEVRFPIYGNVGAAI